jgi:type IX secretion system PorP/SprF family membrane protein
MLRIIIIGLLSLGIAFVGNSQDFQVSQYYAAQTYLNPAFAGNTEMARVNAIGRLQWPSNAARYRTMVVGVDHNLPRLSSGAGILFTRDAAGSASLATNQISGMYAYQMSLNRKWGMRVGLQVGYSWLSIDEGSLTFRDQLNDNGTIAGSTSQTIPFSNKNFFDVSTGFLWFTKKLWIGTTFKHLNRPNMSLVTGEEGNLPWYVSIHGGYQFPLYPGGRYNGDARTSYFSPTFNYKHQGTFDQLDIGAYFAYEWLTAGTWYRGIPVLTVEDNITISNQDALVFLLGFHLDGLSIAYSYDVTISRLNVLNTGGAHELSVVYEFEYVINPKYRKPPRRKRSIPCPRF